MTAKTLQRIMETSLAGTPSGAAAIHLLRAEEHVKLISDSCEDQSAVFLFQAVPADAYLNDLESITETLRDWVSHGADKLFAGYHLGITPTGLVLEQGGARFHVYPNGYIGFAAFQWQPEGRPDHNQPIKIAHIETPLAKFRDLCNLVAETFDFQEGSTWRLRAIGFNGPMMQVESSSQPICLSGVLPRDLLDISDVSTEEIEVHVRTLLRFMEVRCTARKFR